MSEGTLDKRVQASVPSELKDRIRELVDCEVYDSEAEIVRAALWDFVGEPPPSARSAAVEVEASTELHHDLKERLDLLAWLLTVCLLLLAAVASRLLEAIAREKIEPMQLLDQALRRSVDERDSARRKLAAGWRAFREVRQPQNEKP